MKNSSEAAAEDVVTGDTASAVGAQDAVDDLGLAADLGGDPAGEHGDEARRRGQHERALIPAGVG
jgi:hypothetical protein